MNIANFSETDRRYHTTDKSFQRGEDYYRSGAVTDLCQRGNCPCGQVEGNEAAPYQITIQFDAGGISEAKCTCPYDYEGWCKNIVAVDLTSIRNLMSLID